MRSRSTLRLRLLGVCQAAVVGPAVVSVSHQGTRTSTGQTGTQASWELAAGKLFVVGCGRQGLGVLLELPGPRGLPSPPSGP